MTGGIAAKVDRIAEEMQSEGVLPWLVRGNSNISFSCGDNRGFDSQWIALAARSIVCTIKYTCSLHWGSSACALQRRAVP